MSDSLVPQWFVLRENGSFVPLIAYDELPHHIRLAGLNRTLEADECVGMTCVGAKPSRHRFHQIENLNAGHREPLGRDLRLLPAAHSSAPEGEPGRAYGIVEQPPSGFAGPLMSRNLPASSEVEPLPQWHDTTVLASRPAPKGRKVYCSHWMSTGECDFAQQGCIYKHEMPHDPEKLKELGFQDLPKWYRELHGLGKFRAVPGSGAHIFDSQRTEVSRPWRSTDGSSNLYITRPRRTSRRDSSNMDRVYRRKAVFNNLLDLDDEAAGPSDTMSNNDLMKSRYAPPMPTLGPNSSTVTSSVNTAPSSIVAMANNRSSRGHGRVVDKIVARRLVSPAVTQHHTQRHMSQINLDTGTSDADVETTLYRHEQARKQREEAEYAAQVVEYQARKAREVSESQQQQAIQWRAARQEALEKAASSDRLSDTKEDAVKDRTTTGGTMNVTGRMAGMMDGDGVARRD